MHLKNPSGEKNITIKTGESLEIFLEDFELGSREFFLTVNLEGEGSECKISGRAKSENSDKKLWKICQVFKGVEQKGVMDLRGVAEGKSFLRFDGQGVLEKSSENSEIEIQEKIMLFDDSHGQSLPVLTVKTDSVKSASHGASVSPADIEKLNYLCSRGIDEKNARDILKIGFLK